jgi:hypothetical protein
VEISDIGIEISDRQIDTMLSIFTNNVMVFRPLEGEKNKNVKTTNSVSTPLSSPTKQIVSKSTEKLVRFLLFVCLFIFYCLLISLSVRLFIYLFIYFFG